jgi:hypothetical protein
MEGLLTPQRQTTGNGLLAQPTLDARVAGLLGLGRTLRACCRGTIRDLTGRRLG